jgi:hypothetical protein
VYALNVTLHQAGQLAHRQRALALRGAYQRPALFSQLAKEMARAFKVEHLALVSALLRHLGSCTQTGLPVGLQSDGQKTFGHVVLLAAKAAMKSSNVTPFV